MPPCRVKNIAVERGHAGPAPVQAFFDASWTQQKLVDASIVIGDETLTNFLHGTTQVPVDFPAAPEL